MGDVFVYRETPSGRPSSSMMDDGGTRLDVHSLHCMLEWLDSETLLAAGAVCRGWRDAARDPALWTKSRRPCASAWFSRTPREAYLGARAAAAVRASGHRAPVKIGRHCPPRYYGGLVVHDERVAVFEGAEDRTVYTYVPTSPSPGALPAEHRHSTGTLMPTAICLHGSRLAVITTTHGTHRRPLLIDADRPDAPHTLFDAPTDVRAYDSVYGCWQEDGAALAVISSSSSFNEPAMLRCWDATTGVCAVATRLAVHGFVHHLHAAHGALLLAVCGGAVLLLDPRAAYASVARHDSSPRRLIWDAVARPHAPLVAVRYWSDAVEVLDVRAFAAPLLTLHGALAGFAGAHLCTMRESKDYTRHLAVWTPLNGAAPPTTVDLGPYMHYVYPCQADARRLVYGLSDGLYQLDFDGRAVPR